MNAAIRPGMNLPPPSVRVERPSVSRSEPDRYLVGPDLAETMK
jgi:hypothetical protein